MSHMTAPHPLLTRLEPIEARLRALAPGLLGLSGRIAFAAVLAGYFWSSALTKLDGLGLSLNAYAQIFPRAMERVGYDVSALPGWTTLVVAAGTAAEIVLPLMLVLGLLTRLSALGMIGFIAVMTLTDIVGHGVGPETVGLPFDRDAASPIADQRLLWAWLLAVLALSGGGFLSLDGVIRRRVLRATR